jgi:hypothetical protein
MIRTLLILVFILYSLIDLSAQSEQLIITPPSGRDERLFTFENPKGSIRVTGYEGDLIVVNGSLRYPEADKKNSSGLYRIEQKPIDLKAEVNGRDVLLICSSAAKTVDFDIKIPAGFSLKLKSLDNGVVEVINLEGVIEVVNNNGNIFLANINGSAILSSVYGDIEASFGGVRPGAPMMFTTFEGDIIITVPSGVNANLKMKSDKGEIYSEFDIKPVKRLPVVSRTESSAVYTLEDWITGIVNNGGAEFVLRTYSGSITVKKR